MSDEELLKRVAEIEYRFLETKYESSMKLADWHYWNPLTSDSDAMGLLKKHEVWLIECDGDGWHALCDGCEEVDPDLNRAICLAVVAAHD